MSDVEASYQAALDYLYSFVDYSLSKTFRYAPVKFDLNRMHRLLEALGSPHTRYPVIHVAGTKGKGSVCALCASALHAAGYRVGLYTSPHLSDYVERIQVDGAPISHAELVELVEAVKPAVESVPELTTFEITTAVGFLCFARREVDAAVIEVGLGGRLDATNVVTPDVAVITSLSYDHMYLLGDTLPEIAAEKAGIVKEGVPLIVAPQAEEARQVVESVARQRNAPLIQIGRDLQFSLKAYDLRGQTMGLWAPLGGSGEVAELVPPGIDAAHPLELFIPLLGSHQVENAATAFAALQVFSRVALPLGLEALRRGFAQAAWPGRFEVLRRQPPVVVDSAHNRDSTRRLRLALEDYFPKRPVVLVFGASEDKDLEGMFAELLPRVSQVIATRSFHPRAMEPEKIVEMANQHGVPARIVEDVADALEAALQAAGPQAMTLVTGSIFVVAGAREAWEKRVGSRASSRAGA
ncbi:MAG: bifunctional folylpolyglutamate synthase/dihydrofolate synthase [Anaerolineales bacterium]|nr:bifunctional folylpolyglutamate synthase/dihydrofolate synthase [Anaerolineales bacterium]